jgi:hypothetical protein
MLIVTVLLALGNVSAGWLDVEAHARIVSEGLVSTVKT